MSRFKTWGLGFRTSAQDAKSRLRFRMYLEVHGTYNLLSSCSYSPIISRVTVVMGLIFGL